MALMQLRFTSLAVTSSWWDFHPQACAHAGRTTDQIAASAIYPYSFKRDLSLFVRFLRSAEYEVLGKGGFNILEQRQASLQSDSPTIYSARNLSKVLQVVVAGLVIS